MFQQILTIKAGVAIIILLAIATISSLVTYSLVHSSAVVVAPSACVRTPVQEAARKRYFHEVNFNTHDGKRY